MKTLQKHIDEALFSKRGPNAKSAAKKVEADIEKEAIEKLKKWSYVSEDGEIGEPWDVFKDGDIRLGPKGYEIVTSGSVKSSYMVDPSYLMLCDGINEKSLDYKIAKFDGALIVNACDAKDLTWLFTPDCDFNGRLVIEWNEFLTSLKGCPKKVDCFECVYNDKLNSLQGAPQWCNEFTWNENGKGNITEKDIRKYLKSKYATIIL